VSKVVENRRIASRSAAFLSQSDLNRSNGALLLR
jgi:hypothetical protein